MTRRDAQRLLERHAGESICVRYRYGRDGEVRFRPPPSARTAFVAVLSVALAGCAGYLEADELEVPDAMVCLDAQGNEVSCDQPDDGFMPYAEPSTGAPDEVNDDDGLTDDGLEEPTDPAEVVADEDRQALIDWLDDAVEDVDPEQSRQCPTRSHSYVGGDSITMGVLIDTPRSRRAQRRERRRRKRAERRLARRGE